MVAGPGDILGLGERALRNISNSYQRGRVALRSLRAAAEYLPPEQQALLVSATPETAEATLEVLLLSEEPVETLEIQDSLEGLEIGTVWIEKADG